MGRAMGAVISVIAGRRREILERLQICLGVDPREAKRIRASMYRNLGMTAMEFLHMPAMTEEELRGLIRFEGLEHVPPVGTPCIGLVAHTGNWEVMAASTSFFFENPHHVVVKALKPPALNEWVNRVRQQWGTTVHDRRGSARELIKVLRRGEILAFVLDQNAKRNWGVFVEFFGEQACTSDGLSQMAALSGANTCPVFCRRLKDHSLLATVHPPLPPPPDRDPESIRAHTALCTREIEKFVRAHPDQWIWMHRRWRTRPEAPGTKIP